MFWKFLAAHCSNDQSFFGIPTWHKYLNKIEADSDGIHGCRAKLEGIGDIWLVVIAVIDILIRVAALVAFAMIVTGGVRYMLAQGEPDKLQQAKQTIINAAIGLAISISAAILVAFIGRQFG